MAQASSAYSTSGTQYNATNSYYLLDSVPGSGDAIPGPVTITAAPPDVALTVAGNEIVTGSAGVGGVLTASGGVLTNTVTATAGSLVLTGPSAALVSTTGPVNVTAGAGQNVTVGASANGTATLVSTGVTSQTTVASSHNVTVNATNNIAITADVGDINGTAAGSMNLSSGVGNVVIDSGNAAFLRALTGSVYILNADTNFNNAVFIGGTTPFNPGLLVFNDMSVSVRALGAQFRGQVYQSKGLYLDATDGTRSVPLSVTTVHQMAGNKGFFTAPIGTVSVQILFPPGIDNWIAIYQQIGTNPTNIGLSVQDGQKYIINSANILNPMFFSIVCW
jgi:hypothetical protein